MFVEVTMITKSNLYIEPIRRPGDGCTLPHTVLAVMTFSRNERFPWRLLMHKNLIVSYIVIVSRVKYE